MSEYQVRPPSPYRRHSESSNLPPAPYSYQSHGGYLSLQKETLTSFRRPSDQDKENRPSLLNEGQEQKQDLREREFTEVFSWGNDKEGQLGLGQRLSQGKQVHPNPRFCSYNIPISIISCGQSHSVFITTSQLVYSMGSNNSGQLGIGDPHVSSKYSPALIEGLLDKGPIDVKCGDVHCLMLSSSGDVYAWGNNDYGQCGLGNSNSNHEAVVFSPTQVLFDNYYRPTVQQIDCGSEHSAFVDDIGRLLTCGRSHRGQLGLGHYSEEQAPSYVSKISEKIAQVACGQAHTIALTIKGEVYVMGANTQGQLGTGSPSKGAALPMFLEELSFTRIVRVKAGQFSAALSVDQQLFVWGRGIFGEFYSPHRIKSASKLDIRDFELSKGGAAFILTTKGNLYSQGHNDCGQLGQGDFKDRSSFEKIASLEGKQVSQIAVGNEFTIALGLTMAQKEYMKMAKHTSGILQQNSSLASTKSQRSGKPLQRTRSKRPKSVGKKPRGSCSDFNTTIYASSNLNPKRKSFQSGERDRLLKEGGRNEDIGGPSTLGTNSFAQRKSKSSGKLTSVPAVSKAAGRKVIRPQRISSSHRKSPLRSAGGLQLSRSGQVDSVKNGLTLASDGRSHRRASRERLHFDPRSTNKKEQAGPRHEDPLLYKAPSSIHETVVTTLRKEKDQLMRALANERETIHSLHSKIDSMATRIEELEHNNHHLEVVQEEDKKALLSLDQENGRTLEDYTQLRSRLDEMESELMKAKLCQDGALRQAEKAADEAEAFKRDISVLTRETKRLNEEITVLIKDKVTIEDDLHKTELEFNRYREDEYNRNQSLQREMEHLRSMKEAKSTEVSNLKERVDDLQKRKSELTSQLDYKAGDSRFVAQDFHALHEQNERLIEENNSLRRRVLEMTDKNNDLELRLNRSLADRSSAAERKAIEQEPIERASTSHPRELEHRESRVERALQVLRHNQDVLERERERSRDMLDRSQERLNNSSTFQPCLEPKQEPRQEQDPSYSPVRRGSGIIELGASRTALEYEGGALQRDDTSRHSLRRSPPRRSPQRSPPEIGASHSDNQSRLKQSQERIAAILAAEKPPTSKDNLPQNQSLQHLLESKRSGRYQGYTRDDREGGSTPRTKAYEPSGVSQNDSSVVVIDSRRPSILDENPGPRSYSNQIQSSMVRQSLADLKSRLSLMRREKQQVDEGLGQYEQRQ